MGKEEKEIETFCPASRQEWRAWLQENHRSKPSVWLIQHKKKTSIASISWSESVEEALCFGWIDSIRKSLDGDRFMQFFGPRKPNSVWSKINKDKVARLIDEGLMTPAGYAVIDTAKQNGSWTILDEVETLKVPKDLEAGFKTKPGSKDYFLSLSKSMRKRMLQWLVLARRPETRLHRIHEIVTHAGQQLKPKQFR